MNEKKQVEYNPPKGKKEFSTTRPKRRPQKRKNDGQKKQTNQSRKTNKSLGKKNDTKPNNRPKIKKLKSSKNRRPTIKQMPGKKIKTVLFWVFIFMGALTISSIFSLENDTFKHVKYSEFKQMIADDRIESGVVEGYQFTGELRDPVVNNRGMETTKIKVELPNRETEMMLDWKFEYEFKEKGFDWADILLSAWPILLLIGFWIFMMRRMNSGGGVGGGKGIFSFAKSPAQRTDPNKKKVTFKDVSGCDEAKEELQEIIAFLKNPKRFEKLGGKIPLGVLLVGAPGTGKTLLARAVSGEAGVPFFSLSGADFVEMFVGVGASRVRDLFAEGKKNSPCIIFIDEIDVLGRFDLLRMNFQDALSSSNIWNINYYASVKSPWSK